MRKGIVQLVAIGVVIGVAVALVAVLFQWLPTSASEEFDQFQNIYWFATWMSVVIFARRSRRGLLGLEVACATRRRRRGPDRHGHTGLEIAWTAIPAILVIALGIVSAVVMSENGEARANALQVKAIGQQFAWRFEYPEHGDFQSGELVLPVNEQAQFTMEAVDVLHSFWVPNFGQKMDAVPGIKTSILVTPTRTGEFEVVCAELCGLGHATMRAEGTGRYTERVRRMDRGAAHVTATQHETGVNQYPAHFEPPHGSTWKAFFGPGSRTRSLDGARGVRGRRASRHGAARVVGAGPGLDDGGDPRRRRNGARADRVPGRDRVVRLLAPLHRGPAHGAGGSLGTRRAPGATTSASTRITR